MTKTNQNKLAVVFPGIGYHVDKPLLFHTRKLLRELGYEVTDVNYTGFSSGIKGNPQKMKFPRRNCMLKPLSEKTLKRKYDEAGLSQDKIDLLHKYFNCFSNLYLKYPVFDQ